MTRVGYIPGVFDQLHYGHLNILCIAQSLCDFLIIGVHTDEFVQAYKRKPLDNQELRMEKLAKRGFNVCLVGNVHLDIIEKYNVNVIFHGSDWELESYKKQIRYYEDGLDKKNVEIQILEYTKGISTTDILSNKIPKLSTINHIIFDLDKTLVLNHKPMMFAVEFLDLCRKSGKTVQLLTNNNRYTKTELSDMLTSINLHFNENEIISPLDSIVNLKQKVFVWGTDSVVKYLSEKINLVPINQAEIIVILYRNNYYYDEIVQLTTAIKTIPYIIGNIDPTYPDKSLLLPDTGALYKMIKYASGKDALFIYGKPNFEIPLKDQSKSVMIGDSLLTDGKQAEKMGIQFIHVNKDDPLSKISHLGVLIDYFTRT